MKLINLMEEEVVHAVDSILKDMKDVCDCEKCKMDIIAIALNDLPPKYVVTDQGYAYGKANNMNFQFSADIITAVTKGINIVGKNPRHE